MFNTPILFTIFNRPYETSLVFKVIRKLKPKKLYICADGPRNNFISDTDLCNKTRSIVLRVDWPCKVYKNYSKSNLGLRDRMISGIDWFFQNEDEGIIIEDDVLPDLTFFKYCSLLLKKYKNNSMVMHIGGNNYQFNKTKSPYSYYFSKYCHIWGWATWKRAWKLYDKSMDTLDSFMLSDNFINRTVNYWEFRYWKIIFKNCKNLIIKTWDYNWLYTIWKNNGISITPSINLVKNIGISENATNTQDAQPFLKNLKNFAMPFPLRHPKKIYVNNKADLVTWNRVYKVPLLTIIKNLPRAIFMAFNSI